MNVKTYKRFDYLTPFDEAETEAEMARILTLKYPKACSNLEIDAGFFARMVEDIRKYEAWRSIGFKSFEDFCQAKLGKTLEDVDAIVDGVKLLALSGNVKPTAAEAIAAAKPLAKHGNRTGESNSRNVNRGANSTSVRGSTHVSYLAARLKRDHPDIAARAEKGEFKSIRQAAIAAGIIKVPTPFEQISRLIEKLSPDEREEIRSKFFND